MDDPRRSTGFWNADTQQFQREEAEAHQDIKGCCIYLVFLCTFIGTVLAGGTASPDAFWTSSSVKGEIITFNRIVADEIMDWGLYFHSFSSFSFLIYLLLLQVI